MHKATCWCCSTPQKCQMVVVIHNKDAHLLDNPLQTPTDQHPPFDGGIYYIQSLQDGKDLGKNDQTSCG